MDFNEKIKSMADNGDEDGLVDLYYVERQLGHDENVWEIIKLLQILWGV